MDLIKPSDKTYCQKIIGSIYEQKISEKREYLPSIIDLLFYLYDPCYSMSDIKDRELY